MTKVGAVEKPVSNRENLTRGRRGRQIKLFFSTYSSIADRLPFNKMGSISWDDRAHRIFVRLCLNEVQQGNRPNTSLSKTGWENIRLGLQRELQKDYSLKQVRNHWDAMKKDWQLYKKLMSHHSGLGWNEITKTVDADDQWWDERIEENRAYKKFRNKDLSLYWFSYDSLFADVVATGNRARVPSQRSTMGSDINEAIHDDAFPDDGKEGSGDSDDNHDAEKLFPSCSVRSGKSSGSKRKKLSGADKVREGIDTLVAAMSCRSTSTTAATNDPTLLEAIDILDQMADGTFADLNMRSELYYFAGQYIVNKGNRTLFLKARNNEVRYGQLQFNYTVWKASGSK